MKAEASPLQTIFRSPKWEVKPKLHRYPTKRWGHTAVISKSKMYVYGGKTGKAKEPIYEIDCDTFESHILDVSGFPESRESHSCSLIKDKLIIWGGCRQEKALNDCISIAIKDKHCFWAQIPQFPMLKERESHATAVLKDKYILLYGGSNEDEMYDDWWVFNTELEIWFEVRNIVGKMKKRLGCTLTAIRDKIYVFGGETEDEKYENEVYVLSFSELEFLSKEKMPPMTCELVPAKNSPLPPGRSSHSAIAYSDRYLLIIGGEGEGVDSKGKKTSILFNDIWCFDLQNKTWHLIDVPNQNTLKPRSCFSANLYRNKIYIFGGLINIESFKSSDELFILSFSQTTEKSLQVCNLCKLHYQPIENKVEKESLRISSRTSLQFGLNNLYRLSRTIKNPFDAICLIVEAYSKMSYPQMILDLVEGKIIMVQGAGVEINQQSFREIMQKYEFVDEINTEDVHILSALEKRKERQDLQLFSFNIKNACSRLGQTFIVINRRGLYIDLMLVSPENIFYCEYNIEDSSIGFGEEKSFQIIKSHMHRNNLNLSLIENLTFTVVITDLQRVTSTQSEMRVNGKGFIELAGSAKKINLHTYCSTMFLQPPFIKVTINGRNIDFRDMQNEYKNASVDLQTEHDFKSLKLREAEKQSSINIYRGGIRVGRYTRRTWPFAEGYADVSLNYQLGLLRHRLENAGFVEAQLEAICQEFEETGRKRRNPTTVQELEQYQRQ